MEINSEKIIADTLHDFQKTATQLEKFSLLKEYVSEDQYKLLHKNFLTPTSIKIDVEQFINEIKIYDKYFQKWGQQHTDIPRYGIALVNKNGSIVTQDPINGSLHEWNKNFPDNPIIETDCQTLTPVIDIHSLKPLRIFDNHWCRSNILKWNKGAHFKPHIDTVIPSPWLRLWATTNADNFEIRYDNGNGILTNFDNVEPGRLYLIDTSLVHDAISNTDDVYQLFLSVLPSSIEILKEHLCLA